MIRTIDHIHMGLALEDQEREKTGPTGEGTFRTRDDKIRDENETEIKQESHFDMDEIDFSKEDVMILEEIFVELPKFNKKPKPSKPPILNIIMTLWEEATNMTLGRDEEKHAIIGSKQFITQNEASTSTSDNNQKNDLVILKYSEEFDSVDNFIPPPGYEIADQLMEVVDLIGEDSLSDADKQDISGEYFETGEWLETPFGPNSFSDVIELSDAQKDILTKVTLTLGALKSRYGDAFIKALQSISHSVYLSENILHYVKNAIDCLEDPACTNYALKPQAEMTTYSFDTQLLGTKSESVDEVIKESNLMQALDEIESIIKTKVMKKKMCGKCVRILSSDDILESNLLIIESESDSDEDGVTRRHKKRQQHVGV